MKEAKPDKIDETVFKTPNIRQRRMVLPDRKKGTSEFSGHEVRPGIAALREFPGPSAWNRNPGGGW